MEGRTIRSRTTGTSITSPAFQPAPARSFFTWNTTVVPGFPRIFSDDSELVSPWVDSVSILTISSPQRSPARAAGESSYGSLMMTLPFTSGL